MNKQMYLIHYREIGDGRWIKGRRYNGRKSVRLCAASADKAVVRLQQRYTPGAISEILSVGVEDVKR